MAARRRCHRFNGVVRWHTGDEDDFFDITLLGYQAEWTSSDQIPERAIYSGQLDRYGFLDPTNGGQFRQSDQRVFFGGEISATLENRRLFGAETDYTIGFQTRNDVIWDLELARTRARADVNPIRNDDVITGNYSVFASAETKWCSTFSTAPTTTSNTTTPPVFPANPPRASIASTSIPPSRGPFALR